MFLFSSPASPIDNGHWFPPCHRTAGASHHLCLPPRRLPFAGKYPLCLVMLFSCAADRYVWNRFFSSPKICYLVFDLFLLSFVLAAEIFVKSISSFAALSYDFCCCIPLFLCELQNLLCELRILLCYCVDNRFLLLYLKIFA